MDTALLEALGGTMIGKAMLGMCALSVICVAGCGSDPSSESDAGSQAMCPAGSGTIQLTIADVSPARGATVPNHAIVEKFTIKNAPGFFTSFTTTLLATHTAGYPNPPNGALSVASVGNDLIYSSTVDSWTMAPGHVEMAFSSRYRTDDGCIYAFPSPMFSYDVVPVTGGDAGTPTDAAAPTDAGAPGDAGTPTDAAAPTDTAAPTDAAAPGDARAD
jgi:hypothetical protein